MLQDSEQKAADANGREEKLIVDVNVANFGRQKIVIYEGDTVEGVVSDFVRRCPIDEFMAEKLKSLLQQQMNNMLERIDEDEENKTEQSVGAGAEEEEQQFQEANVPENQNLKAQNQENAQQVAEEEGRELESESERAKEDEGREFDEEEDFVDETSQEPTPRDKLGKKPDQIGPPSSAPEVEESGVDHQNEELDDDQAQSQESQNEQQSAGQEGYKSLEQRDGAEVFTSP